jgi:hypothetical protein
MGPCRGTPSAGTGLSPSGKGVRTYRVEACVALVGELGLDKSQYTVLRDKTRDRYKPEIPSPDGSWVVGIRRTEPWT